MTSLFDFTEKVAVITGAGRGIGKAIATELAKQGARVAILSRTQANSEQAAEEINDLFPDKAAAYAVDVSQYEEVLELGKTVLGDFGKIDILINNAGVTRDNLSMRMKEEDWDTVLDTNLKGAFNTVKSFQKSLLKQPEGRIVNISSVIGLMGNAGQVNYAASKAGLIGLTKSLAREFAGRKVTVNAIAPGFILTDMTAELTDDLREQMRATIPLKDFGTTEDIAHTTSFLVSPAARYITGQVIAVDGGMTMM